MASSRQVLAHSTALCYTLFCAAICKRSDSKCKLLQFAKCCHVRCRSACFSFSCSVLCCRTAATYSSILKTNVVGVFLITKAFIPLLKNKQSSTVINISSTQGSISWSRVAFTNPEKNPVGAKWIAYNSSKAALNMRMHLPTDVGVAVTFPACSLVDFSMLFIAYACRLHAASLSKLGQQGPSHTFSHCLSSSISIV